VSRDCVECLPPPENLMFVSFDGKTNVRLGHAKNCVLIQVHQPNVQYAGVIFTADEADRFVRSLRRQVKFSRAVDDEDQVAS
jgi:hypothetical protein